MSQNNGAHVWLAIHHADYVVASLQKVFPYPAYKPRLGTKYEKLKWRWALQQCTQFMLLHIFPLSHLHFLRTHRICRIHWHLALLIRPCGEDISHHTVFLYVAILNASLFHNLGFSNKKYIVELIHGGSRRTVDNNSDIQPLDCSQWIAAISTMYSAATRVRGIRVEAVCSQRPFPVSPPPSLANVNQLEWTHTFTHTWPTCLLPNVPFYNASPRQNIQCLTL